MENLNIKLAGPRPLRVTTYHISLDKRSREIAKAQYLQGLSYSIKNCKIICRDGRLVMIVATNRKEQEKLKVAFQISCRYVDKWRHYFQLSTKQELQSEKETPVRLRKGKKLKNLCDKFSSLDNTVLLFIHRASDFTNVYSEVSVISALFALELQVNITYKNFYDKFHIKIPSLRKPEDLKEYNKLCAMEAEIRKAKYSHWLLLALNKLRNKLAHSEWGEVLTAKVQSCPKGGKRTERKLLQIKELGLKRNHFKKSSDGQWRLTHRASKLILERTIDTIIFLHHLCP